MSMLRSIGCISKQVPLSQTIVSLGDYRSIDAEVGENNFSKCIDIKSCDPPPKQPQRKLVHIDWNFTELRS